MKKIKLNDFIMTPEDEEKAHNLIVKALETDDPEAATELLEQAVELDPFRTDAFWLLARSASDIDKKTEYLLEGITSFEMSHDDEYFEENMGNFWGLTETRPYMLHYSEYAKLQWAAGKKKDAVEIFEYLLELNTSDNLGLRYTLVNWYICLNDPKKANGIITKYPEGSAFMYFSDLLYNIRRNPSNVSRLLLLLERAVNQNPYVSKYILGNADLPDIWPEYYSFGEESEAITYCFEAIEAWKSSPKSIPRLRYLLAQL